MVFTFDFKTLYITLINNLEDLPSILILRNGTIVISLFWTNKLFILLRLSFS